MKTKTNNDDSKVQPLSLHSSGKIGRRHLERNAYIYIRQSTLRQVEGNQESTKLQYGLVQRAHDLGWAKSQIQVIDEDQGKSGRKAENRSGFQKLLNDVSMDQVGIVLGIDMSRLARSCKDWYHLLELCGMFGCLLGDNDGVYDPTVYNDRLLLGLKGTMSEAEIHVMHGRLQLGKINKAKRGELFSHIPFGYVRTDAETIQFDPDEQVSNIVRLVFEKFNELKSANSLLQFLSMRKVKIGMRSRRRMNRGALVWRNPHISTLMHMLHNPFYAGAYAYGRSHMDARLKKTGKPYSGEKQVPIEGWEVLIKDKFPAYITWDQYILNQNQLRSNATRYGAKGVVRNSPALLQGLLVCQKCNLSLTTNYSKGGYVHYFCNQAHMMRGEAFCQSFSGKAIEDVVSGAVLKALEPSSIELGFAIFEKSNKEFEAMEKNYLLKIERAKFNSERAERQYQLVEPENRLVARTLEKQWEEALEEEKKAILDYEHHKKEKNRLSLEDLDLIKSLCINLPKVWSSESTSTKDRKLVIRSVVDRIFVSARGKTDLAEIKILWKGGHYSHHQFSHQVRNYECKHDYDEIKSKIIRLRSEGYKATEIADTLNREGFRPAKNGMAFNKNHISSILQNIAAPRLGNSHESVKRYVKKNEWPLTTLALEIKVPYQTIFSWIKKGWIRARQLEDGQRHWIAWADDKELQRLRALYLSHAQNRWARDEEK